MEERYLMNDIKISDRFMRSTKASKGGEKIVVSFEIRCGNGDFKRFNIVFHHDRVFMKTICYQAKLSSGVFKNTNYHGLTKKSFNFNIGKLGFNYRGEQLPTIELVNLVFKMFTNYCIIREKVNGPLYLSQIN